MKILAGLILLLSCIPAGAQSVQQSGQITPGHATSWTTRGVVQDGGTAASGNLTSLGVTASGPGICQNSGPITGPFNRICMGVTTNGGGLISSYALGGATTPNISFDINGTVYSFPYTVGGIVGPGTTTVGHVALWNNTAGSLLSDAGAAYGSVPYTVTGGNTSRLDVNRWVDNWIEAPEIGVDCTGSADASAIIQAFFVANPSGKLMFPPSCEVSIANTVAIGSSSNPVLSGPFFAGNGAALNSSPHLYWRGTSPGFMFTFTNVDHPIVQNLAFQTDVQELNQCPLGFLNFDGDGGAFTPTNAQVIGNSFSNSACRDDNFIGIDIADTSVNNNENYIVYNNQFLCSGSGFGSQIATDGVTNGTTALTAASAPFVPGFAPLTITGLTDLGGGFLKFLTSASAVGLDSTVVSITGMNPSIYNGNRFVASADAAGFVIFGSLTTPFVSGGTKAGTRIRIAYSGGLVDTTVAAFVSTSHVTLANAPAWSQTGVQIVYGSKGFGKAIRNGASQNAIQQQFIKNQYTSCATGIHMQGGGAQISQLTGGFSDIGVFIGGFLAQNTTVDYYASEDDITAIYIDTSATPPIGISNGRFSNGNQLLSGFIVTGSSQVLMASNTFNFSIPTNGVAIGKIGNASLTSISNTYPGTWAQTGLAAFDSPPVVSIKDVFDTTGAPNQTAFGCWALAAPCFFIRNGIPAAGGVSFDVSSGTAIATTGGAIGIRSQADLGGGTIWTAMRAQPTGGRVSTSQTLVEAGWDAIRMDVTSGQTDAYGFRARTPPTVVGGTLTNIYGLYVDKQKATNVTNGWGVFQADSGDKNALLGGTQFGASSLLTESGTVGLAKITDPGTAAGAAGGKIMLRCGTNAGSARLIAYAGTSTTPVTILDNIGAGVTGC